MTRVNPASSRTLRRAAETKQRAKGTRNAPDPIKSRRHNVTPVIETVPISALTPNPKNPRIHGDRQISKLRASVTTFGLVTPLLVDEHGMIIDGHALLEAAKQLSLIEVPIIRIEHLSKAETTALSIALNRLSEFAEWDDQLLGIVFQGLSELDLDFELEITGFETAEIDLLIESASKGITDEADTLPEVAPDSPIVSHYLDLWIMGNHRLLCGDALGQRSYSRLMGDDRAQMVFADPPYNVPIDGHVCGLGSVQHADFAMASGEMSEEEFTRFLHTMMNLLCLYSIDGSIHFLCMDWRHMFELMSAGRDVYAEQKNLIVWNKSNGGMGSFYRSKHELIGVFKNGTAPHINNFGLGETGRYRTNVWDYEGVNTLRRGRQEELEMHPTVKPVALVADAIKDCAKRGDVVLDPFAGSGTTIIAAEKIGRVARAMELDPHYVDVAVRRWQALTGEKAVNSRTGLTFDEMMAEAEADKAAAVEAVQDGAQPASSTEPADE